MDDRGQGGVVDGERDGGNGLDGRREAVEQGLFLNVENLGGEDGTVVVHLGDSHTVGEGRNVEHVQQGRLGRTDLGAGRDDLDVGDDFDRTTRNLGRDTERLEERGLSGLHTSVAAGDVDVVGGDGTGTRGGGDDVGDDDFANVLQVARGKDKANVALDVGQELLELGVLLEDDAERTADHGVLAHQDDTLAAERLTDQVELLRRDIVDVAEEDGGW